ncbi:TPA: p-aminobenzoyl-glutamate transporter [Serratia fonticola]|jgi:aminobenzoyl-glutamate transport protein|uniref:Aminobenzoyl-glutamate transport protein n=1 Tax=Serratia fonticola TaxID=47917 RepID=A0A3S4WX26_SERFO|nr:MULTISPECIES: p-aminobenzoyl-glutamate transporter [Serratia]AYM92020.1 p-aminobenzoyl-glutamate transporter [Serratia sp. 3ACOL1]MBL5905865.1 p-aminobenzoyl-glutamate transporter [Serratia fonticola]CAI0855909.1 Aminobenzoyl-glutamate transport protein [Serratia fonticola]CAI0932265.1 Aminobenzoyl-glutamate transport protein [Serratia fonticola]CAI1575131.1 Aminobenzoyl-glutamate transport protein [Serratia fonticola]
MSEIASSANKSPGRIFYWVERIGNKIPNPFLLFVYLIVVLMLATALISWLGLVVKNPATGEMIQVKNLLSVEGIQWILPNIIHNFSGFAPLGAILALVIGAGLAEKVGLLQALMYKMASHVSAGYASYMVLFIAFFSHISSDAALVVMPPLGALIFLAVGRNPIAGLLAAIAGVGSGFTANLLIVTTDVLLSGISTEAAKAVDGAIHVSVIDNWYFMATSVIVLTITGALLTDKFIEPRLPKWQGTAEDKLEELTPLQNRGLIMSGISALVFIAVMAALVVPEGAPLRDPQTGSVIPSPFIKGIVPIIILFFFTVAITYGVVTKSIRRPDDIPNQLVEPMKNMAGFIVMVFPLSQFVAFFNWSNMGKFMAIGLTDLLEAAGMSGAPAFLGLMFLSAFLCMFIASGSAIWSILAPIFVPMFMLLGFHPAFAQMIFRIADSSVLPLAPMSPFLPLFLGFLQRYLKDAKLGTYYVLIMPYPLVFFAVWTLLLVVWYMLGLPIGPGVYPKMG